MYYCHALKWKTLLFLAANSAFQEVWKKMGLCQKILSTVPAGTLDCPHSIPLLRSIAPDVTYEVETRTCSCIAVEGQTSKRREDAICDGKL